MNFGLRLDAIFETLNNKAREERASCTERNNWEGYNSTYKRLETDAKQAITSLTKELVAEAKPNDYVPVATSWRQGIEKKAFEDAVRVYEYKLLKALEEV